MNIIFIISSPSGAGKTTLSSIIQKKRANSVKRVVTHTTRKPRKNELDKIDYFFTDEEGFKAGIRRGEFVEYAIVHNNFYGTSKKALVDILESGYDALLAIDVAGAKNVMRSFDNAVSVFILPPSFDEWIKRIKKDGVRQDMNIRLHTAISELDEVSLFDYCIVNDDIDSSVKSLESIIDSEHRRFKFLDKEKVDLIKKLKQDTKNFLED